MEAAGVEPASGNIPQRLLHTYPELSLSPFKSPSGRMRKRLSCKNIRRSVNRISGPTILLVDALAELAGVIRQDASLKRLERSYNHLRLYLFPTIFTSRQELGMQPVLLYPRRSRFAPSVQTYSLKLEQIILKIYK